MRINTSHRQQCHDPYARNHPTDIVLYNPQRHNQKIKNHNEGTMQFLASATLGAVTGNGIARYRNANRSFQLKNDALPIATGTAVPPIFIEFTKWFIEASLLQPTKLRLLQTAIAAAGIAYSMTPKDTVTEDTHNNPQLEPTTTIPQAIPTSPKATPTTTKNPNKTEKKPQNNTDNSVTTENNTQKSLSEQALDFFSNWLLPKQPKQKKETPTKETKPFPLTAKQIRAQEREERRKEREEYQKQQAEALERELAYMQTDAYKEEQRLEAEAQKRKEAEAAEEGRRASRLFDQKMREYFAERNRRSQRRP